MAVKLLDAKAAHHIQNNRCHAGLHAAQRLRNIRIAGKGRIEDGNHRQDGHGRDDRGDYRGEHAGKAAHAPAHQIGGVHGDCARRGLRHGRDIQHFFFRHPVQLIHELALHQGDDDKPAAKGEGADVKHAEKQLDQPPGGGLFLFRFHFLSPPAGYYSA